VCTQSGKDTANFTHMYEENHLGIRDIIL
jgi:hypothetical protein